MDFDTSTQFVNMLPQKIGNGFSGGYIYLVFSKDLSRVARLRRQVGRYHPDY